MQQSIHWEIIDGKFCLECGEWSVESKAFYHDYNMDVWGDTFEDCLIQLANKIVEKYGLVDFNDFYIGDTIELDKMKLKEYADAHELEIPIGFMEKSNEKESNLSSRI